MTTKHYALKEKFPFTLLTPGDTFMVLVDSGTRVKINWENKDLYVWLNGQWQLTNNIVDNFMLSKLEEVRED